MTIEDLGRAGEPAPEPPAPRWRPIHLVIGAIVVAVAFAGVGAGLTLLLTGRSVSAAPPGAGPKVCVAQVAIAFAASGGQSADEVMRAAVAEARKFKVVGAADFAEEPQSAVFDRFRRYYDDERARLFRIDATPAIMWVARDGSFDLNQLAVNAYGTLGVQRVKREQVGIEDPCTGAMRLNSNPNAEPSSNPSVPRPQTPVVSAPPSSR